MALYKEFEMPEGMTWQMLLKKCPDNEFMAFFEDNPDMLYVTVNAKPVEVYDSGQ